jgi:hypothetical protein
MVTSPHYVGMCNIEQTVLDDPYTGDCKRQALEVFVKRTWAGVPPLLSGLAVLLVVHPELTLPVSAGQCSLVMASPRCGVQLYVCDTRPDKDYDMAVRHLTNVLSLRSSS